MPANHPITFPAVMPLPPPALIQNQTWIDFWSWRVNTVDLDGAARLLTAPELKRAHTISLDDARRSFVATRALLRLVLAEYIGIPPKVIEVRRRCGACGATDHGRPSVIAPTRYVPYFSITRSGHVAAVAVSSHPIGVDVERPFPISRELISAVLSADEVEAIYALQASDWNKAVHDKWIRKEAFLKGIGLGLIERMDKVTCGSVATPWQPVLHRRYHGWQTTTLELDDTYACAVALQVEPVSKHETNVLARSSNLRQNRTGLVVIEG